MARILGGADSEMQVLVVDDFATMRRIVRQCLMQLGFKNFSEAENGVAALSKLRSGSFDLIVSDWNMPEMMGIDLLRAVRSDERLKSIPFLMVTAEGLKENVMAAAQAGVSNYIVKPFTAESLREKLEQIYQRRA
jgi:two-component system chemotaxis response regulator CheY